MVSILKGMCHDLLFAAADPENPGVISPLAHGGGDLFQNGVCSGGLEPEKGRDFES